MAVVVWRSRRPGEWRRWLQGAKAERRTGRMLDSMVREGWGVLHDRRIPRSKANLDHILVHPSGAFLVYVDTKAWHARGNPKIRWESQRGRLMYGPWNKTEDMRTVEWEASRLQDELGLPVVPIIACDRGNVRGPDGNPGVCQIEGTYVLNSTSLVPALLSMDQLNGHDPRRVNQVRRNVDRVFPAAK